MIPIATSDIVDLCHFQKLMARLEAASNDAAPYFDGFENPFCGSSCHQLPPMLPVCSNVVTANGVDGFIVKMSCNSTSGPICDLGAVVDDLAARDRTIQHGNLP